MTADRGDFGDSSRWLINKHANRVDWLLHEPIRPGCLPALMLPTFEAAVAAFIAFSAADLARVGSPLGEGHS
jgi:hypothetical protein